MCLKFSVGICLSSVVGLGLSKVMTLISLFFFSFSFSFNDRTVPAACPRGLMLWCDPHIKAVYCNLTNWISQNRTHLPKLSNSKSTLPSKAHLQVSHSPNRRTAVLPIRYMYWKCSFILLLFNAYISVLSDTNFCTIGDIRIYFDWL